MKETSTIRLQLYNDQSVLVDLNGEKSDEFHFVISDIWRFPHYKHDTIQSVLETIDELPEDTGIEVKDLLDEEEEYENILGIRSTDFMTEYLKKVNENTKSERLYDVLLLDQDEDQNTDFELEYLKKLQERMNDESGELEVVIGEIEEGLHHPTQLCIICYTLKEK
jgi:hypothetical protein